MSGLHGMWSVGALIGSAAGTVAAHLGSDARLHHALAAVALTVIGLVACQGVLDLQAEPEDEAPPRFSLPPKSALLIGAVGFCAVFAEGASLDWSAVYLRDVLDTSAGARRRVHHRLHAHHGDRAARRRRGGGPLRRGAHGPRWAACSRRSAASSWWSAPHPAMAMGGFALLGLGIAVVVPLAFAAAGRSGPNPSQAIAGVATITYTSGLIAPSAIGTLADATSLVVSFGLVTVLACGLARVRGRAAHGRPRRRRRPVPRTRRRPARGADAARERSRYSRRINMALIFRAIQPCGAARFGAQKATLTMDLGVRWKLHGDGRTPAPGAVVRPDERLSWPRTIGLGAQHVVAMFGASFVAPVLMGLDPNLAIMMSGVATVIFLLATRGRVPSYLGCSLSFVGRRRGHPRAGRLQRDGDRRGPRGRRRALPGGSRGAEVRGADHPRRDAADRDRRGRHADRLQPRAGDGVDVLAAGPVDGAPGDAVHRSGRGVSARLLVARRDLPRAGLRLRDLLALRPGLRQDPLGGRHRARSSTTGGSTCPPSARPTGSACRPSTRRASSGRRSSSRCPSSSRWSRRTPGTSRPSAR